jgi:hypothetical protein
MANFLMSRPNICQTSQKNSAKMMNFMILQELRLVVYRLRDKLSVVYKFQNRFRNSGFWSLLSLVYRPRFSAARSAEIFSYTLYHCFSHVLYCFLNKHGRAQRRKHFNAFLHMFYCISMYFSMKVAARSTENFKTVQFVVSSLQQKVRFSKF